MEIKEPLVRECVTRERKKSNNFFSEISPEKKRAAMALVFARAPTTREVVPTGNSIVITLDETRLLTPGDEIRGTSRDVGC